MVQEADKQKTSAGATTSEFWTTLLLIGVSSWLLHAELIPDWLWAVVCLGKAGGYDIGRVIQKLKV